jgi:hypothetical protein
VAAIFAPERGFKKPIRLENLLKAIRQPLGGILPARTWLTNLFVAAIAALISFWRKCS